jgi:hypothetical protein
MSQSDELLVSTLPLKLGIVSCSSEGELRVIVEGFDPITVTAPGRIILRPEGYGVVIEREANDDA